MRSFKSISLLILLELALQSCGLSGNVGTHGDHDPPVLLTRKSYLADIQADTTRKMVSLTKYLQPLRTDWKYADTDNFTHQVLYKNPEAFLRLRAAEALQAVQEELRIKGIALKIFDAYRPYSVTRKMWEIVPDERYAANPAKGSGHNRGIAVDLSLVNLETGIELQMPTPFDNFTEKAHHTYMELDSVVLANRHLLRTTMEKHGFRSLVTEWWHYFWSDGKNYPLMDFDFDTMRALADR